MLNLPILFLILYSLLSFLRCSTFALRDIIGHSVAHLCVLDTLSLLLCHLAFFHPYISAYSVAFRMLPLEFNHSKIHSIILYFLRSILLPGYNDGYTIG